MIVAEVVDERLPFFGVDFVAVHNQLGEGVDGEDFQLNNGIALTRRILFHTAFGTDWAFLNAGRFDELARCSSELAESEFVITKLVKPLLKVGNRVFGGHGSDIFDLLPKPMIGQVQHYFGTGLQIFKRFSLQTQPNHDIFAQAPTGGNGRDVVLPFKSIVVSRTTGKPK